MKLLLEVKDIVEEYGEDQTVWNLVQEVQSEEEAIELLEDGKVYRLHYCYENEGRPCKIESITKPVPEGI